MFGPPIVSTSEYPKGKIGRFRGPGDLIGALQRRGHGSEKTLEVGSALPGQHIPPCWGPVPSRIKNQESSRTFRGPYRGRTRSTPCKLAAAAARRTRVEHARRREREPFLQISERGRSVSAMASARATASGACANLHSPSRDAGPKGRRRLRSQRLQRDFCMSAISWDL